MSDAQSREQQFDAAADASLADGSLLRRVWDALTDRLAELSTEVERDRAMRTLYALVANHRDRMRRVDGELRRRRKEQLSQFWTTARSLVGSYSLPVMKLFVRLPHHVTMVIEIDRDATLFDLKCRIQDKSGLRPCEQRLGDGSGLLEEDSRPLWHFCSPSRQNPLVPEIALQLSCAECSAVPCYIFWGSYAGFRINQLHLTIEEICDRVAELSGIPVRQQRYRLSRTGPFVEPSTSFAELVELTEKQFHSRSRDAWRRDLIQQWPQAHSLHTSRASTSVYVQSTMDRFRYIARLVGRLGAWRARAAHRVYSPLSSGYAQAEASFLASSMIIQDPVVLDEVVGGS